MTFKKLTQTPYPRRQWTVMGPPGVGKSTLAAQMAGPILVVDADHRFGEVAQLATAAVYEVSENPADHVDAERIVAQLKAHMQGSGVRTIVVDSLTAIITPLVVEAVMSNDAGQNKNKVSAFKSKAMAMRLLQDAVTSWGTDVLWIYHTRQGLDGNARQVESTSISAVELARLRRSLNMQLSIDIANGKRSITVDWARRGRYPVTLEDDTGIWRNMLQRIEEAVYGGLSDTDMDKLEKAKPTRFSSPADAISWGFEQGCFNDANHAKNAYEELKRETNPPNAVAMWMAWIGEVERRLEEKELA